MRSWALAATLILAGLAACNQKANPPAPATTEPVPANQLAPAPAARDDRTPLEEPHGPIDPKSAEAAGQIVQSYGALIEQKRWREANALWADAGQAAKFHAELAAHSEVHLEIGNLLTITLSAAQQYHMVHGSPVLTAYASARVALLVVATSSSITRMRRQGPWRAVAQSVWMARPLLRLGPGT